MANYELCAAETESDYSAFMCGCGDAVLVEEAEVEKAPTAPPPPPKTETPKPVPPKAEASKPVPPKAKVPEPVPPKAEVPEAVPPKTTMPELVPPTVPKTQELGNGGGTQTITLDLNKPLGMALLSDLSIQMVVDKGQAALQGAKPGWRLVKFDDEPLGGEARSGHSTLGSLLEGRKRSGKGKLSSCSFTFDVSMQRLLMFDLSKPLGMTLTKDYRIDKMVKDGQAVLLGAKPGWQIVLFNNVSITTEHHGHSALTDLLDECRRTGQTKGVFGFDTTGKVAL